MNKVISVKLILILFFILLAISLNNHAEEVTQRLYSNQSNTYNVFFNDGSKIITNIAARGRRRHEPSGNPGMDPNGNSPNPNHFNYHLEYWNDRVYQLQIRDYVSHGQSRIEIELNTVGAHATNSDNEGSNVPYVKCFKDFGNETNYFLSPAPQQVAGSNTRWTYEFTQFMQDTDSSPGGNYETEPDIGPRAFRVGDLIECEVTVRWQAIVDAGETEEANYYGEIFRYRVGVGGLVGYNRDPNNGLNIQNMSSMIGGFLTSPIIGNLERPRAYMQPSVNTQFNHMDDFLEGRRVLHTSFNDGSHLDASNSSNGANPSHPSLALGINDGFDDRCSDCHLDNGNGDHTNTASGFLTPRLVGLGLLEAIPESTVEGWADPDDQNNDGISGKLSIVNGGYLGRFGYQATAESLEQQIRGALDNEMNVQNINSQFLNQMVAYVRLLAVPSARSSNLNQHEGIDEFRDFGCNNCHKLSARTTRHPFMELRNQNFRPFTDLLLHDLGEGEFRTTPLMGIGLAGAVRSIGKNPNSVTQSSSVNGANGAAQSDLRNNRNDNDFMIWHDGSCTGSNALECAILKHNGEGQSAKDAYQNANSSRKNQLINFLRAI